MLIIERFLSEEAADFSKAFDVGGNLINPSPIKAVLPTLEFLIQRGAAIIIGSHIGVPGTELSKKLSLKSAASLLEEYLKQTVNFVPESPGAISARIKDMSPGEVVLLENLLHFPGEEKNNQEFVKKLASLADIYVNNAIGASRYNLASVVGLAEQMEHYAGFSLYSEIEAIESLFLQNSRPLMIILGGVDLGNKVKLINKLMKNIDYLLIGGGISYTFLKSRAVPIGTSLFESELQVDSFQIIEKAELEDVELYLPEDHIVADKFSNDAKTKVVGKMDIDNSWRGMDIGPRTISTFEKVIKKAASIFWYGPMGVVEIEKFSKGTQALAKIVSKAKGKTVVSGENCIKILNNSGLSEKINHICYSSRSTLEILHGQNLPGIESLKK